MKGFGIGTLIIIAAAAMIPLLIPLGVPHKVASVSAMVGATVGFIVQMYSAFALRSRFNREVEDKQRAHRLLLAQVGMLPSQEAVQRLLRGL